MRNARQAAGPAAARLPWARRAPGSWRARIRGRGRKRRNSRW